MIKRPLVCILAAYLAGMYLAWHRLSPPIIITIMLLLCFCIYLFLYRVKNPIITHRDRFLWCLPFVMLLGFLIMKEQQEKPELYTVFDEEVSCELTGRISMIVEKQWGRAIYLKNNRIRLSEEDDYPCENVIVFCRDNPKDANALESSLGKNLLIGNQVNVFGTLLKFSTATNPGQFNEQLYYKIENIDFKLEADRITVADPGYSKYHAILGSIKSKLIKVYETILGKEESGALVAMLLGEKYLLGDEIKELYQENGISHLLAISGLHVSLIGMFIYHLLKKLKLPITVATLFSIFFIISYGVLTNFSVSTNRAVIMMILTLLSPILGKTYDMLSAISLSAFLILIQNPYQILSAGFLLSYGAVLGIAIVFPLLLELFPSKNPIISSLFISVSAQVATLPVVVYFYYQVPVYSVITNLIILPFVTVLTLTSLLAGIVGAFYLPLGIFLIGGSNYILKFYEWVCRLGSDLPGNLLTVGRPELLRIVLYGILTLLFVGLAKRYHKKATLLLLAAALLVLLLPQKNAGLEITFLDVGQGDAVHLKTKYGTTYLIDGGSQDVKKVGTYRLEPFLLSEGTDCITYAIVTHSDNDHTSGLIELLNEGKIKVENLLLPYIEEKDDAYVALESLARDKGVKVGYLAAGDQLLEGEFVMHCLHPSPGYRPTSTNAYSTVLSITYGEFDLLLTGDLESDGEIRVQELLMKLLASDSTLRKPAVDYDVLKVAHHGSKNSTGKEFLTIIKPELSLISCSKNNSYGHPHAELLDRLDDIKSKVVITYESGAITIKTDGERIVVKEYNKFIGSLTLWQEY